jgi:hypothetical protein
MNEIIIECDVTLAGGSAKGRVSAFAGDNLVHEDRTDLASGTSRMRFAKAVAAKLSAPDAAGEVERLLMAQLADLRGAGPERPVELDVSAIIRPELFITPDVVGMTVPTFALVDRKPAGKWRMYLRWSDGRREAVDLGDSIDLPDGRRFWLHPRPAPPPADLQSGWSSGGRQAWLDGAPAPDPAQVFRRLCEAIARFLDFPPEQAAGNVATLALWIMLTYVYQAWDAVPYLYVGGPKESGKSTVFRILERLAARPVQSSNMSAASMFRRVHDRGGTVLLDEAERLKHSTPDVAELRSILLAGYKRGGKAMRCERIGDGQFTQTEFDVFGPKAVACIAGLPAALGSRCIPLMMFRAAPGSAKPRRRIDEDPARWSSLRDDLHALAFQFGGELLTVARWADVCPPMSGRSYELWQPLMALAAWLEDHGAGSLLAMVQAHALSVIEAAQEDQTPDADELILQLLTEAVNDLETPTPGDLLTAARAKDPEVFRHWGPRGISNVLRRYGITTKKSNGNRVFRDVSLDDLARVQRNYGIELGIRLEPLTPATAAVEAT